MKKQSMQSRLNLFHPFLFLLLFLGLNTACFGAQDPEAEKLRIAAAQHEVIQILLKENRLDEVQPELDKILDLRLSPQHEERIIRAMLMVSEAFLQNRRADLCLRMLERGIAGMQLGMSKSKLYQEMGYIYRLQGNNQKAMECFRKAQQWAQSAPHP